MKSKTKRNKNISTFSSVTDKINALGFNLEELHDNTWRIQSPNYSRKSIYVDTVQDLHEILDTMLYAQELLAE